MKEFRNFNTQDIVLFKKFFNILPLTPQLQVKLHVNEIYNFGISNLYLQADTVPNLPSDDIHVVYNTLGTVDENARFVKIILDKSNDTTMKCYSALEHILDLSDSFPPILVIHEAYNKDTDLYDHLSLYRVYEK